MKTIRALGKTWVKVGEDDACPECGSLSSEPEPFVPEDVPEPYDLYRCDDCQLRQAVRMIR